MKKQYAKPEIIFENFALSTSIAAGCEAIVEGALGKACALQHGRKFLFTDDVNACTTKVPDGFTDEEVMGPYTGVCYHVPSSDKNVFNS